MERYVDQQKENYYSKKLISKKWREIREQQGYTLEEVSREVGISAAHLSKLENGNANLSLDILNKLALFYHESPLYFMLTDVLLEGTQLIYLGDEDIFTQAFNTQLKDHTCFLPGVVSRKKQIIPMLSALWG